MSSYEVVERGAAAGIVITASHNPWTDNGFKVKAPTGAAAGPDILAAHRGADRAQRRVADRPPAVRRRRGGRPGRAVRPVSTGYERFVRRTVDLDALQGRRRLGPRRADVGRRRRLDPRGCWPAAGSGSPRSTRSATRTSAASTPSRSGRNIDEALGILAGGGYDLGLLLDGDADRAGAADEQGTFIHQLAGHRPADVLPGRAPRPARAGRRQRQQHVDGGAPRRALRHRDATRRRSASSSSGRR